VPKAFAPVPEEQHFVLTNHAPGPAQKRLAVVVVLALVLVVVLIAAGPLSCAQTSRVDAFIPAYLVAMFVNDSITAILLFAQFSILRSRAVLVIASGYLFMALMLIPYVLTFPGVFAPKGVMGGLQSPSWLYFFQYAVFPIFVIAYALLKDADPSRRFWHGATGTAIVLSILSTAALAFGAASFFIAGEPLLPHILLDGLHESSLWPYVGVPVALVSVAAFIVLWSRRRSMLDLWLLVVMCVYAMFIPLSYFSTPVRFSVGWYAIRIFAVLSSGLVLTVLLYEITTLYGRLLNAVVAQRRERVARLMTSDAVAAAIAHEVKQPLSAMITRAETGLRRLDRQIPDLEKAKEEFRHIAADGHRAGGVIDSIRANFKKDVRPRTSLDVNDLVEETVALVRDDLHNHRVVVEAKPNAALPPVRGDRIQLQQVLLNLINNAIDSMANADGSRVLSVRSELRHDGDVVVSVADTGTGIGTRDSERIFNPLFTTKSGGMGMGLSICRSIVEAHDGELSVLPNVPRGAIFQFALRPSHDPHGSTSEPDHTLV
jgi:signal transduction histidine kinase